MANAAGKHGILPASARFVVPASTAAASKLVLFDVMDTIVADPFFRGFHKVTARTPSPAGSFRVRLRYGTARALCTPCALCCSGPLRPRLGQGALRDQMPGVLRRLRERRADRANPNPHPSPHPHPHPHPNPGPSKPDLNPNPNPNPHPHPNPTQARSARPSTSSPTSRTGGRSTAAASPSTCAAGTREG